MRVCIISINLLRTERICIVHVKSAIQISQSIAQFHLILGRILDDQNKKKISEHHQYIGIDIDIKSRRP